MQNNTQNTDIVRSAMDSAIDGVRDGTNHSTGPAILVAAAKELVALGYSNDKAAATVVAWAEEDEDLPEQLEDIALSTVMEALTDASVDAS